MARLTLKDQLFTGLKGPMATLKGVSDMVEAKKIVRADLEVKYSSLIDKKKPLPSQVRVVRDFEE